MKKIILIGAGGHAKSCIDVIKSNKSFKIEGVLDNKIKLKKFENIKIIGSDDFLNKLRKFKYSYVVAVGQIKNYKIRENIFNKLKN